MNALSPNLHDTDFKQLVTLARSLLPRHAPDWTDHNLHDPGIMLIELLAWVTEAQIYSVARVRTDQRWAYGALFNLAARGPLPATGMAWPAKGALATAALVAKDTVFDSGRPQLPQFRLNYPINLTAATLRGVQSRRHDGQLTDHTAANARRTSAYYPFGLTPHPQDRLILTFDGALLGADTASARAAFLALGVRIEAGTPSQNEGATVGCLHARLMCGQDSYSMPLEHDGTAGFTRSGVLLLGLRKVPADLGQHFSITLGGDITGAPRAVCIAVNVLPMEQAQRQVQTLVDGSSGLPDQLLALTEPGVRHPAGAPRVSVQVAGRSVEEWDVCADLSQAGPGDRVYRFDAAKPSIAFGNGVNGAIPAQHARVQVDYDVTEGELGNLAAGQSWRLLGVPGQVFENLEPTSGGASALDLAQLRRQARAQVREAHPIVTGADLEQAAMRLGTLRVARAHSLAPAACAGTAAAPDWLLVVLRERATPDTSEPVPEDRRWLRQVQQVLAPRVLLGERLRVVAPAYVRFRVEATLGAREGYDGRRVASDCMAMLETYFRLLGAPGSALWPLGRAVRLLDVQARLLGVDGVAAVTSCVLLRDGERVAQPVLQLASAALPLFQVARSKIDVSASAGGALS